MKARYNSNYMRLARKTPVVYPKTTTHHMLPLQFVESSMEIELPYYIHRGLHQNFSNHQLLLDPVGCLVKCILQRLPRKKTEVTLGQFFTDPILKFVRNGFAYNAMREIIWNQKR